MKLSRAFLILLFLLFIGCGDDGAGPDNRAPVIQSLTANPEVVGISESTALQCAATDPDNDVLVYNWSAEDGAFPNGAAGTIVFWRAPSDTGTYPVTVNVSDGQLADNETIDINVVVIINRAPVILSVTAVPEIAYPNSIAEITCIADDEDGDLLTYAWSAESGSFPYGTSGSVVQWQAPAEFGEYYVRVLVDDGRESVQDSVAITVDEPPTIP